MSRAEIVIRRARPADGERVAELVLGLARFEGKVGTRMTADGFRRFGFGARARFSTLVATCAGTLQGYAIYMPVFSVEDAKPGFYLDDLYVEPDWRRAGVGRLLLQRLARECHKRGFSHIMWHVRLANTDAMAFYDRIDAVRTEVNCRWIEGDALARLAERH
ncbi:MAG: GNAT family N-acetyltransferase [Proteobacteria bacterium]|nr:GNAT family N-acetyltransferase [Pseudomonadota bacterium]MBI3499472.1 GNAT family N-acetyltransferase [Pseudomonadota bacterium]